MSIAVSTICSGDKKQPTLSERALSRLFWFAIYSLLFMAVFVGACNMCGASEFWYLGLPFLPLSFLYTNKKNAAFTAAICAAAAILACLVFFEEVNSGLKLLINGVFQRSEAAQNYKYEYFTVNVVKSAEQARRLAALLLFALVLSVATFYVQIEKSGILITVFTVAFLAVQVYFGVYVDGACGLLFAFSVALILALNVFSVSLKSALALCACFVLIFALSGLFSAAVYSENAQLYSWSEDFRDLFGEKLTKTSENEIGEETPSVTEPNTNNDTENVGSDIGRVPFALIVGGIALVAVLLIPIVKLIICGIKRAKNKRKIYSLDNYTAINAAFKQALIYLAELYAPIRRGGYASHEKRIEEGFGKEYATQFSRAVVIWGEVNFSLKVVPMEIKKEVVDFYKSTLDLVKKRASVRIRLRLLFGANGGAK